MGPIIWVLRERKGCGTGARHSVTFRSQLLADEAQLHADYSTVAPRKYELAWTSTCMCTLAYKVLWCHAPQPVHVQVDYTTKTGEEVDLTFIVIDGIFTTLFVLDCSMHDLCTLGGHAIHAMF
eukprot:5903553-Amphidinium_carterae.1